MAFYIPQGRTGRYVSIAKTIEDVASKATMVWEWMLQSWMLLPRQMSNASSHNTRPRVQDDLWQKEDGKVGATRVE